MNEYQKLSQQYFEEMWQREQKKLRAKQIEAAVMHDGATVPIDYCVSTVARLLLQTHGSQKIAQVKELLADVYQFGKSQFIYPPESMHISLVGCTQREESPNMFSSNQIDGISEVFKEAILGQKGINIHLKGLGIIRNQVFIQGIAYDSSWADLREKFTQSLEDVGELPISYPDKQPIHLNIVRLTNTSANKLELLDTILQSHRETDLGTVRFDSIELVITDFVLSKGNFKVIEEFKFN